MGLTSTFSFSSNRAYLSTILKLADVFGVWRLAQALNGSSEFELAFSKHLNYIKAHYFGLFLKCIHKLLELVNAKIIS